MRISHSWKDQHVRGEGRAGMLLTNKKGNYLALSTPNNASHYEGYFHFDAKRWELLKSIESIGIGEEPLELANHLSSVERRYDKAHERFVLCSNALLYELEGEAEATITLDARYVHDFSTWGRVYDVEEHDELLLVHYRKYTDASCAKLDYESFLAIASPDGCVPLRRSERWIERRYAYDVRRGSAAPDHCFELGSIASAGRLRLILAASTSREKALGKARRVREEYETIQENTLRAIEQTLRQPRIVPALALRSLDALTVRVKGDVRGIFAGLPWFYQVYARDEAICLRAKALEGRYLLAKELIFRSAEAMLPSGRLPNRMPHAELGSADAVGWLFARLQGLLEHLVARGILNDYFTRIELAYLRDRLERAIETLHARYLRDGLIWNAAKETWMDTVAGDDGRPGARIEIQALAIRMYRCAQLLSRLTKTGNGKHLRVYERERLAAVRRHFLVDGRLVDGLSDHGVDRRVRPNLFLALYLCPDLVGVREWRESIEAVMGELWCEWGGLRSLSCEDALFVGHYSGLDNRSYHRGDSWFFLNNLAAVALHRLDAKAYEPWVRKIRDASVNEMLYSGWAGHCAEVSSASYLESAGCWAQAWSAASLVELLAELGELI